MRSSWTIAAVQFALTAALLTANLGFNLFRSADDTHFAYMQMGIEGLALGRVIIAGEEGLLSYGGFMGKATSDSPRPQHGIYLEGEPVTGYEPYMSQIGLQGLLAAAFDVATPFPPRTTLNLLQQITALWTALALSVLLVWLGQKFGPLAWASALAATLFSTWVTVLSNNLYWASWAFYLPSCAVIGLLTADDAGRVLSPRRLVGLAFLAVLVKCLFNGYEFMTTTLMMMVTPLVIAAGLGRWSIRKFTTWGTSISAGATLAVVVTAVVLCSQIALVEGSFSDGLDHLTSAFERRSRGEFGDNPRGFQTALNSSNTEVLKTYLSGTAIGFERAFDGMRPQTLPTEGRITYADLLWVFVTFSVVGLGLAWRLRGSEAARRLLALVGGTWFAALAPLSWFILFKAHAFIHTNVDFIVWHMPFVPVGFALCGYVLAVAGPLLMRRGAPPNDAGEVAS